MTTTSSSYYYFPILFVTTISTVVIVSYIIKRLLRQPQEKKKPTHTSSSSTTSVVKQEEEEEVDYSNQTIPDREITLDKLSTYNGSNNDAVWIGINGLVYDVTSRREMYSSGSGGSYGIFAGTDATRGLAKSSLKADDLLPLGSLDGLTDKELKTLSEWEAYYRKRYKIIGKLVKV
jgi:membrane-associated progesterone receptor component